MQVKCTSCGAPQDINDNHKNCNFCGSVLGNSDFINTQIEKININGNYFKIAETSFEGEDYDEAIKYYNKCLEIDTNFFEAWYKKGLSLIQTSTVQEINSSQALSCFKQAIANSPQSDSFKLRLKTDVLTILTTYYEVIEASFSNLNSAISGMDFIYRFKRANIITRFIVDETPINIEELKSLLDGLNKCRFATLKATLKVGSATLKNGGSTDDVIKQLDKELIGINSIISKIESMIAKVEPGFVTNNKKDNFLSKWAKKNPALFFILLILWVILIFKLFSK